MTQSSVTHSPVTHSPVTDCSVTREVSGVSGSCTTGLYAYVQDVNADWQIYEAISSMLGESAPDGMIARVAGPIERGFRVIEIWESEHAWEEFRDCRLRPALRTIAGDASEQSPTFLGFSVQHAIFSSACARRGSS